MNRLTTLTLTSIGLFCLAVALPVGDAHAQQMQRLSFKTPAANTKYTQQHVLDVGDVPGHQVRIYELHRIFPTDAPVINGVKVVETWGRNISDYTDNNGPGITYTVYMMEGGDKFFSRGSLISQSSVNADGTKKNTATSVATITGGTGKFAGIKGTIRTLTLFDQKTGLNEAVTEIEYSVGK
jgi:hypothetical protein